MHGIEKVADAPKKLVTPGIINNIATSGRDLQLDSIEERLTIVGEYYGDTPTIQQGKNMINSARNAGYLNLSSTLTGSIPNSLNWVAQAINTASIISPQSPTLSVPSFVGISGSDSEFAEIIINQYESIKNNNPPISILLSYINTWSTNQDYRDWIYGEGAGGIFSNNNAAYRGFAASELAQNIRAFIALNTHFLKSSHHLLYNYNTPTIANLSGTAAAKTVAHKNQVETLSNLSFIQSSVFSNLLTNRIMQNNASGGIQPYTPSDTIDLVVQGGQNDVPGIGFIDPATVVVLGKLVGLFVSALTATTLLVNALRSESDASILNRELDNMGLKSNSPDPADFRTNGNTNTGDGTGISFGSNGLLIGGAAIAAYALLNNR